MFQCKPNPSLRVSFLRKVTCLFDGFILACGWRFAIVTGHAVFLNRYHEQKSFFLIGFQELKSGHTQRLRKS